MDVIKFLKRELPLLVILLAPIVYLLIVWDRLPDQLPSHWDFNGEVNGYGPKYYIVLLNIGLYLLLLLIPKIDPRKKNYDLFSSTYFKLRFLLILFFSVISSLIITKSLGHDIDIDRVILIGCILLFIGLGNYMGTIKTNWFIGVRTPWTLENETVWKKTHLLTGRLWFWMGLILLVFSFFLPKDILNKVFFISVIIMVLIPIVYSYGIYQDEMKS
jgi:uncharacterized membrane protein